MFPARLVRTGALVGLALGWAGGALMHFPPYPIQQLVRSPLAVAAVDVLALGTAACLVAWAREPGDLDRRAHIAASACLGGLAVVLNLIGPARGWWGGRVFDGPLWPLALLTGLRATVIVGLLLLGYRWLDARRR